MAIGSNVGFSSQSLHRLVLDALGQMALLIGGESAVRLIVGTKKSQSIGIGDHVRDHHIRLNQVLFDPMQRNAPVFSVSLVIDKVEVWFFLGRFKENVIEP